LLNIKKIIFTLITIIVAITITLSGCQEQEKTENIKENNNLYKETKTLYVGYSNSSYYKTIQDALDNSIDGDTIIIENGSYNELLNINKSIKLIGTNKNSTIIDYNFNKINQIATVNINNDCCIIKNLTVKTNINDNITKGIYVKGSNTLIENNIISGIAEGIYLAKNSENNTIKNNKVMNNNYGVYSHFSINNIISNNIILSNKLYGIYICSNSDYNSISNNIFSENNYAIRIKGSKYNKVFENCITNNDKGAYCCCGAYYNMFYSNIFGNNFQYNAKEGANLINFWYNYETNVGNYWDEYDGIDENKDGFGDTPLIIPDTKDEDLYPLMEPPSNVSCD